MTLLIGESPNFSFYCIATTRNKAKYAMYLAWVKHQQQTGATGTLDESVTVNYIDNVALGEVYRDYQPLGLKPSRTERQQTAVRKIRKALGR